LARLRSLIEGLFGVYLFRAKYFPRGVKRDHDIKEALPKFRADVVFDVGANIGQSARAYLIYFAGAQIFCFEPVGSTFFELRENMKGHSQVHCYRLALGASRGEGDMVLSGASVMFHMAGPPQPSAPPEAGELERVDIQALDDFCRDSDIKSISYLKIDTEGYDLEVLKGAQTMLREQRIDLVEVEAGMYPGDTRHVPFEKLKEYLEQQEYFVFALYEQMYEWSMNMANLRRINPVFVSRRVLEENREASSNSHATMKI